MKIFHVGNKLGIRYGKPAAKVLAVQTWDLRSVFRIHVRKQARHADTLVITALGRKRQVNPWSLLVN